MVSRGDQRGCATIDRQMGARIGCEGGAVLCATDENQMGSCNPGTRSIRLKYRLAKKPSEYLEYIVVHEMVHLVVRHHNDRFGNLMDKMFCRTGSCLPTRAEQCPTCPCGTGRIDRFWQRDAARRASSARRTRRAASRFTGWADRFGHRTPQGERCFPPAVNIGCPLSNPFALTLPPIVSNSCARCVQSGSRLSKSGIPNALLPRNSRVSSLSKG